jgi:hypothetical protein
VDFLTELSVEMSGWTQVNDEETEKGLVLTRYGLGDGLKYCFQHGLSCLINILDPCDQQVHS